jgi:hypothetical protein
MCVDCVIASSRIAQVDPDDEPLFEVVLSYVFREPKLPKTRSKLIVGATTMVKKDITPTDAPIHTLVPISSL